MRHHTLTCIALLGIALLTACTGGVDERRSMILVVIDTLRADHLGVYGYERPTSPSIDGHADRAAVFERAFASSSWTLPSMGSMFTGQLPTRHGAGILVSGTGDLPSREVLESLIQKDDGKRFFELDRSLPTLAEQLRDAGYATAAVVNNSFLAPEFGLARGFDHYDYNAEGPIERTADVAVDRAIEWLAGQRADNPGQPYFLLLHIMDPHLPYTAPPPFEGSFANEYLGPGDELPILDMHPLRQLIREGAPSADRQAALQVAIYDEEIAYTDRELDRLFAALDAAGMWDDSIVVLTSDHGEEFFDHGRFEHGHSMYNEVLRVPLMVWGAGIEPGRHLVPVSLVDLFPTLLDVGDLSPGMEGPGVSLLPLLAGGPTAPGASPIPLDRMLIAERTLYGEEKKAVIRWPWKVWVNVENDYKELFELDADPRERINVRDDHRDLYFTLLAELQEAMVAADTPGRANAVTLNQTTLEHLRALGYLR